MTKKEAIKVLRTESIELGGPAPSVCRFWEALDMAIAALREQDVADKDVGTNEPLTNAQKIRALSDEELAKLLCCTGWRMIERKECLEWLQQTAEEDDHDERKENENA